MIRRARLSFKPNVRPGGRAPGGAVRDGGGEAAAPGPEEAESCAESTPPVPNTSDPERPDNASTVSTENQPSIPTSTPLQRRKRISTLPNLAKPRVSSAAAVTPSQKRPQAEAPPTLPVSSVPNVDVLSPPETTKVASALKTESPAPVTPRVALPDKRTPIPQLPQFSPYKKPSLTQSELSPIKPADTIKGDFTPLKERPPLKTSPNEDPQKEKPKKMVAAGFLERERLRRAKKLRELLKDELRKERKILKAKHPVVIHVDTMERSKMTMRDFIYFIPTNNPMTSSFEEPKTPEKTLTDSQVTGPTAKNTVNEDEDDIEDEEDDSQLLAPRVKVAEDGSIILDEESLTVEVLRNKAPIVEGNDPIFERGSTTTYSSFRKSNYSKPWSDEETDMFFLAISMVGTDFSMIGQLFPHRERIEIKNKFKREERSNSWRIDKAFKEKQAFDFEMFAKRLEKALEKKQKTPRNNKPREKRATKPRVKQKEKAATEQILSDGESAILSDGEVTDARIEEKENEDSLSVKESLQASDKPPRKKRKPKKKNDLDEENPKSQDEETAQVPQNEKKSRKKGKSAPQSKDGTELENENQDDVLAGADTVPEKQKKTKKAKKKKQEESISVDIGSPARDSLSGKAASSTIPDNAEGISQMSEGEDVQLSQSEVPSCEDGPSLLIFPEESGCLSGLSGLDLTSLQDCLSEVPVTQSSLMVPDNTMDDNGIEDEDDDDVVVETCTEEASLETSHAVFDGSNEMLLEDEITMNSQTKKSVMDEEGTKSKAEQNASFAEPKPLSRNRFQKPKPNIPGKPLARREKDPVIHEMDLVSESNESVSKDDPSSSLSLKKAVSVNRDSKATELPETVSHIREDPVCPPPEQKDGGTELPPSHAEASQTFLEGTDTAKEDVDKETSSRPVRGRLVRPKPNLTKVPIKKKTAAPEPEVSTANDPDTGQPVPSSTVLSSPCVSANENDSPDTPKVESYANSQDGGAKSSIKPAPLLRGRFQRPKPNVMRASRKENSDDKGVSLEDRAGISEEPMKEEASTSCDQLFKEEEDAQLNSSAVQEILEVSNPPAVSIVKEEDKKSSQPIRGRLQRPKPNLRKPSARAEEKGITIDKTVEESGPSTDSKGDLSKLVEDENEMSTPLNTCLNSTSVEESSKPVSVQGIEPDNVSIQLSPVRPPAMSPEDRKKSIKSSPVTPEHPMRPTPNELQQSSNKAKPEMNEERDSETTEIKTSPCSDGHDKGKSAEKGVPSAEKNCERQNACTGPVKTSPGSPIGNIKSLTDESAEPVIQRKGRLQRPKPSLGPLLAEKPEVPALDASRIVSEGEFHKEGTSKSEPCSALPENIVEDAFSPEQTHSFVIPLGTIGFDSEDQPDQEESFTTCVDQPSLVNKDVNASEDGKQAEQSKPATTRSRFQRPKPNLGRSVTRPAVSGPPKKVEEDSLDASSSASNVRSEIISKEDLSHEATATELSSAEDRSQLGSNSTQIVAPACSEEPAKESSVKPVRNRFQKPKPNLGRVPVRKATTTAEQLEQGKGQVETGSKTGLEDARDSNEEKPAQTTLKPAPLKRGRSVRPVPNLRNPASKKQSPTPSKIGEENSPADKACEIQASSSSPGGKRKSVASPTGLSPKRERPAKSEKSELDLQDSSGSTEAPEDNKPQLSRFGRPLKKPPPTAPPLSHKPSDNSSEKLEEKTAKSAKLCKSKVVKPVSKPGKTTLVKLRATRQDEEEDDDEVEDVDENYDLSPENLNQAPAFVPFRLRSPKYVPAQIEETGEEIEIPVEDVAESSYADLTSERPPCLDVSQHMSGSSTEEDFQKQSLACQDVGVSEDTTFILTLVEIPIGEDYSYSCDVNSVEALPAPVLISSGSADDMSLPQIDSSEPAVVPDSYHPPEIVQEHPETQTNQPSRKRRASSLSEENDIQPSKKALVCNSAEEGEDSLPRSTVFEENGDDRIMAAGIKPEERPSLERSFDNKDKVLECKAANGNPGTSKSHAKHQDTRLGSFNANLPSSVACKPSVSATPLQRPGRKPLGFLSLICKEKQSKTDKKDLPKTKCKNVTPSVQKSKEQIPAEKSETLISNKVPSPAAVPSESQEQDAAVAKAENNSTLPVSDNEDVAEGSPKPSDLASEEDAAQVSQFFLDDIFMEVDD